MKKLFLLLLALLPAFVSKAQSRAPVAQWHFNGDRQIGVDHGIDWTYDVFSNERNEYVCCGYTTASGTILLPVIFKLDNLGNLIWTRVINGISGSGGTYPTDNGGILFDIEKTRAGYAVAGCVTTNSGRRIVVIEFDENGNLINPTQSVF